MRVEALCFFTVKVNVVKPHSKYFKFQVYHVCFCSLNVAAERLRWPSYTAPEKGNEVHCYEGGENCRKSGG